MKLLIKFEEENYSLLFHYFYYYMYHSFYHNVIHLFINLFSFSISIIVSSEVRTNLFYFIFWIQGQPVTYHAMRWRGPPGPSPPSPPPPPTPAFLWSKIWSDRLLHLPPPPCHEEGNQGSLEHGGGGGRGQSALSLSPQVPQEGSTCRMGREEGMTG